MRVGRADNHAKHTARSACSVGGRLGLHRAKRARAARHGTRQRRSRRFEAAAADRARCLRQEPRPTALGGARRELAAQTIAPSPQRAVHSLWAVGWFFTGRSARGPRATGPERDGCDVLKPKPPTGRGVGEEKRRPTAWGRAKRELAAQTTAPSPQRAVNNLCSVGSRLVLHVTKRARAARHGTRKRRLRCFEAAAANLARCLRQEPRPTAWGRAKRELAAQTTAPSPQRAVHALWAVGCFSTGRSARGPRSTGLESDGYGSSKPQPPTGRGVCARSLGQRRGVEHVGRADNRVKSAARSACSSGGWLVHHVPKRVWAARKGNGKRQL